MGARKAPVLRLLEWRPKPEPELVELLEELLAEAQQGNLRALAWAGDWHGGEWDCGTAGEEQRPEHVLAGLSVLQAEAALALAGGEG